MITSVTSSAVRSHEKYSAISGARSNSSHIALIGESRCDSSGELVLVIPGNESSGDAGSHDLRHRESVARYTRSPRASASAKTRPKGSILDGMTNRSWLSYSGATSWGGRDPRNRTPSGGVPGRGHVCGPATVSVICGSCSRRSRASAATTRSPPLR